MRVVPARASWTDWGQRTGGWRFLEHAFWVLFCDAFLILSCYRGVREIRELAEQGAIMEALAESAVWERIVSRGQVGFLGVPMPPATNRKYDQVQVQRTAGAWTTLTAEEFARFSLSERVQLILEKKLRFLAGGAELTPFEALKD